MSLGDYLSSKSEAEYNQLERQREHWEMEHYPEGEIREMIDLYVDKGMDEEDATKVANTMAKYEDLYVDVMMAEELGIVEDDANPVMNALVTFVSFVVFGFIPLFATVFSKFIPALAQNTFLITSIMTGLTLFILGVAKSRINGANSIRSGMEMLVLGGLAAFAAWAIGYFLGGLAQ